MKQDDDDIQDYVRPWVGLTDEEILKIYSKPCGSDYIDYARAIEAKLKEKNT